MIKEAHYAGEKDLDVYTIVLPVLVVPVDRIWTVWYNQAGKTEREPTVEGSVTYYLGKSWLIGDPEREYPIRYYFSHLEIVQIDNLDKMINKFTLAQAVSSPIKLLNLS